MPSQAPTEPSGTDLPRIHVPRFVGRDRELASVASSLHVPGAVVLVEGEAGIGKTRLIREYLAIAQVARDQALVASCPPFRCPQTLGPVTDALRQATSDVAGLRLTRLAGALRPLFPEWSAVLPQAPEPAADATAARHRLFRAFEELLASLGVTTLVIEDAHWADEATLEFLLHLASRRPRPVSLVVTYRPEEVPDGSLLRRLSRLAVGDDGLRLSLGPLDTAQTASMMSSMLAGEDVSAEFASFMYEQAGGVPLAVEELVRLMADRAELARHGGLWMRRELAEVTVPSAIRDAVLERAARLRPDARAVLRAAAVLGEPGIQAILIAVVGFDTAPARAGLSEALASGLLSEDQRGLVSFRHVLACRAVYESLSGPERRALHELAGKALERVSPQSLSRPSLASLTRHFREAGDIPRWLRYGEQAADVALAAGDAATAAMLLHDLVTVGGLAPPTLARLASKIVLLAMPEPTRRLRELASALRAAIGGGRFSSAEGAHLRFQLGRVLITLHEHDASREELERAVADLPTGSLEATRAMMLLAWPQGSHCTRSEHLRWLRRAADALPSAPPAEQLRLLVDRTSALLLLGEESGWAEADRIPWEGSARERLQVCRAQGNIGELAIVWGRYAEAQRRLTRAAELAGGYRYPQLRYNAEVMLAHLDWLTGSWDGLPGRLATTDDDGASVGAVLIATLVTGLSHAAAGAREQAVACLQLVIEETSRRGTLEYTVVAAAALARQHLAVGDAARAVKVTDEPAAIVAHKDTWIWATDLAPARVAALAAAGRTEEAAGLASTFARGLRGRDAPAPKAGLTLCRAILAEACGERSRAVSLFARAADAWQALPRPYDALLAREWQARCLLADGKLDDGLTSLAEVFGCLCDLGARGDAERVAGMLNERGVRARWPRRGGRRGYRDTLSPRELEIVKLLAHGYTDRQIASSLFVSAKTVAYHLNSARRKLGAPSRTALVVCAIEAGVLPATSPGSTERDARSAGEKT
jgi:DNA-binding CsgD family transcriptional regulator/tetratricopeptide (TPR) repeat protein